jgi:hypothetical protein
VSSVRIISFWFLSLLFWLVFSMLCMVSALGILVCMFFMSNEHILLFLSICMVLSFLIRVLESLMLYVYDS